MLTTAQKAEDYKRLWDVLNNCFPFRCKFKKKGLDWAVLEEKHYDAVVNSADDLAFCKALSDVFEEFKDGKGGGYFAHIRLFEPSRFRAFQHDYNYFMTRTDRGLDTGYLKPWVEALNHERSEIFYSQFNDKAEGWFLKDDPNAKLIQKQTHAVYGNLGKPNAYCAKFPGDIAYLRVDTLRMESEPEDEKFVVPFLKSISDCKHLIIDFRKNGGGDTGYWRNLILSPIISERMEVKTYLGVNSCEYNEEYVEAAKKGPDEDGIHLATDYPDFPNIDKEEFEHINGLYNIIYNAEPAQDSVKFKGKVWLLVSRRVYSSAEAFAVFCKQSKFATLVGEQTGGDGIGFNPMHYCLPNSGVVFRYAGDYGLNMDGTSNAETGTTPDIACDKDDALFVCLKTIKEMEE